MHKKYNIIVFYLILIESINLRWLIWKVFFTLVSEGNKKITLFTYRLKFDTQIFLA